MFFFCAGPLNNEFCRCVTMYGEVYLVLDAFVEELGCGSVFVVVDGRGIDVGSGDPILDTAGHVSADYAKEFAETEFEKYRVIQDRLFQSDFDRLMNEDDLLELPKSDK